MDDVIVIKQKKSIIIIFILGLLYVLFYSIMGVFWGFRTISINEISGGYRFITILAQMAGECIVAMFTEYALFFFLKRLRQGKDILIVDDRGITDNSSAISLGFIPWSDIDDIYTDSIMFIVFIELVIHNEDQYINKLTGLKRMLILFNKKFGQQLVCINLITAGVFSHDIYPKIMRKFDAVKGYPDGAHHRPST